MKKEIVPLKITAPSGPGQPAILQCESFEGHIHRFDEALELTFAIEFPSCTVDQLGTQAKADTGFERYFCGAVAVGYALGLKASKTSAHGLASAARHSPASGPAVAATIRPSVATAAVTTNATVKTFAELVADGVRAGKTKSEAVRFCIASHPREYALARVIGIPSL